MIKYPFFKLNQFKKNIYSQYGEDGIIEYLIKTSKVKIHKTSIEFGAHDGYTNSNTCNLWLNNNFKSILIEGNNKRFNDLQIRIKNNKNVLPVNKFITPQGINSINNIVKESKFINYDEIGVMSIDIDSYDYHILKNLTLNPQIIIIEYNNSIPGYKEYFDLEDETFLRCSAKSIQKIGFEKGYYTVACTVTNCILIKEECFNPVAHPNLPIEYLLDYEGMEETSNELFTVIHSQLITSKPFFSKKINFLDRLYFDITRRLMSLLKIRKEKFQYPNKRIQENLKRFKIY